MILVVEWFKRYIFEIYFFFENDKKDVRVGRVDEGKNRGIGVI